MKKIYEYNLQKNFLLPIVLMSNEIAQNYHKRYSRLRNNLQNVLSIDR